MTRNYHPHLAIAIVFCPLWGWAQDEVESNAAFVERYLSEIGCLSQSEIVREVKQRGKELMPEIERRVAALESGTDRYSAENQVLYPPGGALLQLGHLANTLGDKGFAHAVWKRIMRQVIDRDLNMVINWYIMHEFLPVATRDDLPMLNEIVESESKFPSADLVEAQKKIDQLGKEGGAQSTANDQPTTRPPPAPRENPTRAFEAPEAEKPNIVLYVVLGFLVVAAVAFFAALKARKQ